MRIAKTTSIFGWDFGIMFCSLKPGVEIVVALVKWTFIIDIGGE